MNSVTRPVYLTAGDILTGAGDLQSTWEALLAGQTALRPYQLEKTEVQPLGIIPDLGGEMGTTTRLERLLERLFQHLPPLPAATPLICATTKGAIDEIFDHPTAQSGQIWQLAEYIRSTLGLNGESSTVSAACASGTIALIQGAMRIGLGECEQVLVVGLDLLSSFVVGGFNSLKGLSATPCRPFDHHRDGLSLGEGGGWLLLSGSPPTGTTPPCQLAAWSVSCDATHITAPCRQASGLGRVLEEIINQSTVRIGAINGHGTGTVYNDAMELLAFDRLLEPGTPLHSVKGCIGHCLGGAGVIEAAIAAKSLETNLIPPTVGLNEPEKTAMNCTGKTAVPLTHPAVLSCNSGFGGINAAVLLKHPPCRREGPESRQ